MAYAAGVDVGSTQTKAVIIDEARRASSAARSSTPAPTSSRRPRTRSPRRSANGGVQEEEVGVRRRHRLRPLQVTFGNTQVTEISCHGRGAVHMFPGTRTVVDMGGQDTKAIRVSPTGEIVDFCMNDKCAAGTGVSSAPSRRRSRSRSASSAPIALRGRASRSRSAPPARSSPSPRCSRGSGAARRSRTSCSACTSRSRRGRSA